MKEKSTEEIRMELITIDLDVVARNLALYGEQFQEATIHAGEFNRALQQQQFKAWIIDLLQA